MNHFPIPEALAPENMIPRVRNAGLDTTLNNLTDRGIYLNTWQAAELIGEGNRRLGKTFVSYVKAAEASLERGGEFCHGNIDESLDPDLITHTRRREWLKGFSTFLFSYYADAFRIKIASTDEIVLIPKAVKNSKIWWNQ